MHLECATDKMHYAEREERLSALMDLHQKGKIAEDQFGEELSLLRGRDLRYHGSALFIIHNERRYLLTARHVVWNEHVAKQNIASVEQQTPTQNPYVAQYLSDTSSNRVFNTIFRVPSLDEELAGLKADNVLMNLGSGNSRSAPFTFSDPSLDLALISIDQRNSEFADELISRGYIPIPSTDIADGPDEEGQELLAIGFPSSTALVGQANFGQARGHWSSNHYSLPISSFGRVAMFHSELPFFWADISIYPGNSGGPVIANDRLIGIVSAQATLAIDQVPEIHTRIPFGKIIKASYVHELIATQIKKDNL